MAGFALLKLVAVVGEEGLQLGELHVVEVGQEQDMDVQSVSPVERVGVLDLPADLDDGDPGAGDALAPEVLAEALEHGRGGGAGVATLERVLDEVVGDDAGDADQARAEPFRLRVGLAQPHEFGLRPDPLRLRIRYSVLSN